MDEHDEDVWTEILKRVPMESLGRFRCVCKRWNSFISSAFFIKLHFTFHAPATPPSLKPYLHFTRERCALHRPLEGDQQQLHFPFRSNEDGGRGHLVRYVGVVHGVVCATYSPRKHKDVGRIFLWNPSIRKCVALPRHRLANYWFCRKAIGFGYDAGKDDFKVVAFCGLDEVYSVRLGGWRPPLVLWPEEILLDIRNILIDTHRKAHETHNTCFVNGTIHWLVRAVWSYSLAGRRPFECPRTGAYYIVMFDCESEELRRMDIPEQVVTYGPESKMSEWVLFEYAGMLAIFVELDPRMVGGSKHLWVMEEHGTPTSWKKIYTLELTDLRWDPWLALKIIENDPSFEIEKRVSYGPTTTTTFAQVVPQTRDLGGQDGGQLDLDGMRPIQPIICKPDLDGMRPIQRVSYVPSDHYLQSREILCKHVYDKSLFLMDYDPKSLDTMHTTD